MSRGALALVLHSHMPYVEGFDTWPFGEEWLWEAVATVYLPLIDLLEEAEAPVTLGLTPVLCDQLETLGGDAGGRLERFLGETRPIVHDRDERSFRATGQPELAEEVRRAAGDYERALERLRARGSRIVEAFAALAEGGPVELWSSAASHAILPMLATDPGRSLQIATGIASHERRFGSFGGGFWLPECAYEPGLERDLADHGVRAFCIDQTPAHGLGVAEQLEPVMTAAGVVAVPLDWLTVDLVWHAERGYPCDPAYRSYHGRTEYDLHPWNSAGTPYRPAEAATLAARHARDFVERCVARLDTYEAGRGRPGLLCCAIDTELLGHWWYEGQAWLGHVFEEARSQRLDLVTVSEGLERVPQVERPLVASTWGEGKDLRTWDAPAVAEAAFAARGAELRTVAAAAAGREPAGGLERAARELLALQASDWAFQITRGQAGDYALQRIAAHAAGHAAALAALGGRAATPDPALRNLAPDLELAPLTAP